MFARFPLVAFATLAVSAWATPPRKQATHKAPPTAADAKAALKTNCGCSIEVMVETDSYATKSAAAWVSAGLASVERAAGTWPGGLCSDEQKAETCEQVKAIHVGFRKINATLEHGVKREGTTLVCVTGPHLYCAADEFVRVLKAAAP